jgi:predicted N-formylglutamate amidohydrolase
MSHWQLILTCEHGGNEVPEQYRQLFAKQPHVLLTHRGYDIGALELADWLSKELKSPLIFSTTSRLLVDLNRSTRSRSLFSLFTKPLSSEEKQEVLRAFYFPYRQKVAESIERYLQQGKNVLHLSIHSFTPILNGKKRKADIAFLYDPQRELEKEVCKNIAGRMPSSLVVRHNYPYKGNADGLTTSLRNLFSESKYVGIEIEVNQAYGVKEWEIAKKELFTPLLLSIKSLIPQFNEA